MQPLRIPDGNLAGLEFVCHLWRFDVWKAATWNVRRLTKPLGSIEQENSGRNKLF